MKILHCLGWLAGGGVEQRRVLLAERLPKDKFEHAVICQNASGPVPDRLRDAGWTIHEIGNAPGILNKAWHDKALALARRFRPDIVHGAVYEGEALAVSIGLRMPDVRVITEETSDPTNRRWTGNLLMYAMCMKADVAIGVSPAVVAYLRHTLRLPKHKVRLINNAVPEVPSPAVESVAKERAALGINPSDLVIGSVGRLYDDHKKFSNLIRALPALLARHPEVRLLIIGRGPDLPILQALAAEHNVEDAVIFAGFRSNVRDYYHMMDILAQVSAHEAFGLVLVEAMLAQVPVVATRVGGMPFVLDEGACGVLVPPGDANALVDALSQLIENPVYRAKLGILGRDRACSKFSAERYCREVEELYLELGARK